MTGKIVFGPGTVHIGGKLVGHVEEFQVEEFDFGELSAGIGQPGEAPVLRLRLAWWVAARLRALADRLDRAGQADED